MITTISNFCDTRGVSRQYVYESIKKGKFKQLQVPVYINVDGVFMEVGTQKVIDVPLQYAVNSKLIEDDLAYIKLLTNHPVLEKLYINLLNESDNVKRSTLRQAFNVYLETLPTAEKVSLENEMDLADKRLLERAKNNILELEKILSKN